ncbi:MAG: hypothetical protein RLZZ373_2128 [Pseudomonadota bacterium]|jgi:alpha-tubulin suppressor-like RCC1 family protein
MSGINLNWRCGAWTCTLSAASMLTWAGAPSITSQPVGKGVQRGQSTVFTVAATSAAPATALTYQWRRNGVNLAGATAISYTTPVTALTDDNALYSVQVKSAGVTVTSTDARLTVVPQFARVSTGFQYTAVVGENGALWVWGSPGLVSTLRANPVAFGTGQLSRAKASASTALTGVSMVSVGGSHALALKTDGSLTAWGSGLAGDGGSTYRLYPVPVKTTLGAVLTGVASIATGGQFSVAARTDGTVWAWGTNTLCVLGIDAALCPGLSGGAPAPLASPVLDLTGKPLANVSQVAAAGTMHALALKKDGTVWSWGWEQYGHLGNGAAFNTKTLAKPVLTAAGLPLSNVVAVAAGVSHSVALLKDGTVYAWGYNAYGQLGTGTIGIGTSSYRAIPVKSSASVALTGVAAVAAGDSHTLFLKSDGSLWGVGSNLLKQIGGVTTASALYPIRVLDLQGVPLTGVSAVSTYDHHSVVVKTNGTAYAWGNLSPGQVPAPVLVLSP